MGTLADVFVRVLADDSAARRSLRSFKASVTDLGRQKAEPKVGLDTAGADAQVKALRSHLAALQKSQVTIPIKASRLDADIAQLRAKLADLTAQTYEVPIDAQGDLNKEIRLAEAQLAKMEKRRIQVPISLERVGLEIASVQAQLAGLERRRIRIPVDMDAKTVQQVSAQITGLLAGPAIVGAAGIAAGALASVTAGLFAMGAAAGPAFGSVAAGAGSLLALGQGAAVAKFAMGGVADASKAVAAAQASEAAGYKLTEAEVKKIAKTYGLSSVAAQGFVKQLLASRSALDRVRTAAQEELFPALTSSLRSLSTNLLPVFRSGVVETTIVLATLAKEGTALVTSGPFRRDFGTLMSGNAQILYTFGGAGMSLLDIFRNLAVAALPLTSRFADFIARALEGAAAFVQLQRDTGGLTRFFQLAGDTAAQLGRIVGNTTAGIFHMGRAGRESGQSLMDALEGATRRFREFTGSVSGQNQLRDYFQNAATVTREVGRLVADVTKAIGRMGANENLAPLIAQVRTQLVPAIESLMNSLTANFGPNVVRLLTTLAGTFERLTAGGGALDSFVGTLDAMARALNAILDSPLGPVVSQLLALAGTAAAIGLVGGTLMRVGAAFSIVGKVVGPAAVGVGKFLLFNQRLHGVLGAVGRGVVTFGRFLSGALVKGLRVAAIAARGFMLALVANPIGLVVTALVALGVGLYVAWRRSETFRKIVTAAFNAVKAGVLVVLDWFRTAVPAAWEWVRARTAAAWNAISLGFRRVFGVIRTIITTYLAVYRAVWTAAWNGVRIVTTTVWNAIRAVVTRVFTGIRTFIVAYLTAVRVVWTTVWNAIRLVLARAWEGIRLVVTRSFTAVRNFVSERLANIRALWTAGWAAIRLVLSRAWEGMRLVVTRVFSAVRTFISDRLNSVRAVWSAGWTAVRTTASRAWDAIQTRVQGAMNKVRDIIARAKTTIGRVWQGVIEAVKSPVRGLFRFLNDHVIGNVNGVISKFNVPTIPNLPLNFASGGYVSGPGGGRDDRIRANLSDGEFVVNAKSVRQPGVRQLLERLNATDALGGFGGPMDWMKNRARDAAGAAKAAGRGVTTAGRVVYQGGKKVAQFGADVFAKGLEAAARTVLGPLKGAVQRATSGQGVIPEMAGNALVRAIDGIINMGRDRDKAAADSSGNLSPELLAQLGATIGRTARVMAAGTYSIGMPPAWRGGYSGHTGQDLPAATGTPVFAPWSGALQNVDLGGRSYGRYVSLQGGGGVRFIGAHLSRFARGNGMVQAGELIGYVGSSGNSTGPHLHAEVRRNGAVVEPRSFLRYDQGGLLQPGAGGVNLGRKPERVLDGRTTEAFEQLVRWLKAGGPANGGRATNVNVSVTPRRSREGWDVADAVTNALAWTS